MFFTKQILFCFWMKRMRLLLPLTLAENDVPVKFLLPELRKVASYQSCSGKVFVYLEQFIDYLILILISYAQKKFYEDGRTACCSAGS